MFIILVLVLLGFGRSVAIKCVSINNQQCMIRRMLIDLSLDKLHYCPFIISLDRFEESCNTVVHPFGRICDPNKMDDVNPKVFNMIKEINESKTFNKTYLM